VAIDKNQQNQTKQAKKFQNLSVDYSQLVGKFSMSDRLSMLQSSDGRQLLSNLSPYQLADMFPDYYKRQYPDVGKLLKSIADPGFKGREYTREQANLEMQRGVSGRAAQPEVKPGWVRKWEEQTGQKISDPGAKAQLSDAKRELLREMQANGIKADDPRVKFLGDLSDDDLKKAGISKQTDSQGNTVYRRNEISDEQAKARAESIDPKIESIRKTILGKESSGNYGITSFAEGKGSTASGGYQFADKTWQEQARKAGFDPSLYPRAMMAPADVQDAVARSYIKDILRRNNGDISAVPREWYAGPKGYLNENELKVNRGLTVEQYTSDWMRRYESNAKASGVPGSQIAFSLEEAKKQMRGEEESFLAGKTEIGQLPQGLSQGVTSFYNKLTDRQKQDFYRMLTAAGGGSNPEQIQSAVGKVNDLYKQDPRAVQQGIFSGNGRLLFSDQSVAERAAQLSPDMQGALNKFQEFAPEGTTITSTYRSPEHEIERRKPGGPGAHSRGSAVDVRTGGKSREELQQTIQALKRAGFTKILLEGDHIHAEVNPGQSFHISNLGQGNPNIDLRSAHDAASLVAYNEELPGQQLDRERPKPPAQAKTEPTLAPSEVTATQEQQPNKPERISSYTPAEQLLVDRTVSVFAEGGSKSINSDQIKAMPIKSIKGDNSVVVDKSNNPLFTMNTKEEQAVYNPKTRQVDVQPLSKTNPDALGEKQTTETMSDTENTPLKENQQQPTIQPTMPESSSVRSSDTSLTITDDIFKDPSFRRAIGKTRFVDTGDAALGGHFGMANADLG
jgi:hypothetical protein